MQQEIWHADTSRLCEKRIDSIWVINMKPNLADFAVAHVHDHRRVPTGPSPVSSACLHRDELDSMFIARQDIM
jgi:hypothetical protein